MTTEPTILQVHTDMETAINPYESKAAELRKQYAGLTIAGIEDSEGYANAKEAAKIVRAERLAAKKEGSRIKKAILEIKRQFADHAETVVGELQQLEDELRGELKRIVDERRELREAEERAALKKFEQRTEQLFDVGFTFNGFQYTIGRVFVAAADIQGMEDEDFAHILTKGTHEAERIEAERKSAEAERQKAEEARKERERQLSAEREALEKERQALEEEKRQQEEARQKDAEELAAKRLREAQADIKPEQEAAKAQQQAKAECKTPPPIAPPIRRDETAIPRGFQTGFDAAKRIMLDRLSSPEKLTRKGLKEFVVSMKPV